MNLDLPTWSTVFIVGGSVLAQLLIVLTAWFKFKREIQARTKEIKYHSDVSIQKLNGMLTSVIMAFDRPAWVKIAETDDDGKVRFRMLEMNDHYGEMNKIYRQDYIGKTDLEAGVPKDIADSFYAHDIQVWSSGEPKTFVEEVNGKAMRFRKLRVVNRSNNKVKGVMGYAIDLDEDVKGWQE